MTAFSVHPVGDDRLDLTDYLRQLGQRWLLLVIGVALGFGFGFGISQTAPHDYHAQSTVFVKATAPASTLYERSQFALERVASYAALASSNEVLEPVVKDLDLGGSGADLAKRVTVTNPTNTVIIRIAVDDSNAQRAADIANAIGNGLSQRVDQIDSIKGTNGQTVTLELAVPAVTPQYATGPSTAVIVLLGMFVGLALASAIAVLAARMRPRIATIEDVRRATGLPVIGQLPAGRILADPTDNRSRALRLRTALRETAQNTRVMAGGEIPRRLLLARTDSVLDSTGVDAGLARAFIEIGNTVSLVQGDVDTRLSSEALAVSSETVTQDAGGYDRILVPDEIRAAGRPALRGVISTFFDGLSRRYDVTVVQTSSHSLPLDLQSTVPAVEGVVMIARANRTSTEALRSLYAELVSLDVQPLGVVLVAVPSWRRVLLRSTWRETDLHTPRTVAMAATARKTTTTARPITATTGKGDGAEVESEVTDSAGAGSTNRGSTNTGSTTSRSTPNARPATPRTAPLRKKR